MDLALKVCLQARVTDSQAMVAIALTSLYGGL